MIEVFGDAWELSKGNILCITTNDVVKKDGRAVMGKGIAKEAADRFPQLPEILGERIEESGSNVYDLGYFGEWNLYSFPTKYHWWNKSDKILISISTNQLLGKINILADSIDKKIYLPRPGCSNGGLEWKEVKPIIDKLDDRFYIVAYDEEVQ